NRNISCKFIKYESVYRDEQELDKFSKQAAEICTVHSNLPLIYYCETCKEAVCSDCAMFGDKHKYHNFKKINDVYTQHVDTIKAEIQQMRTKLDELHGMMEAIDDNLHRIQKSKEEVIITLLVFD